MLNKLGINEIYGHLFDEAQKEAFQMAADHSSCIFTICEWNPFHKNAKILYISR
jgi:hypothetical protein